MIGYLDRRPHSHSKPQFQRHRVDPRVQWTAVPEGNSIPRQMVSVLHDAGQMVSVVETETKRLVSETERTAQ